MNEHYKSAHPMGRLFNYANNPITIIGGVLATLAALLIMIFITIEIVGGHQGAYTGILAFLILPMIFVAGLVLVPTGMWFRRRRLLSLHVSETEIDTFPRLDFNDPHLRKVALVFIVLTSINAILFGSASYIGVEYMESVDFCGTVCHTVMSPEFTAYQQSPHSRVRCVQCHIGPGASWFVKSKVDGIRQVISTTLNTFSRPISSPIVNLRPARDTCESCHWPSKHIGDKLRTFVRFAQDENNTPSYNAMIIKTGGGNLDIGRHGGVHWWHIYSDNKIRYIPGGERRMEIRWVELTTPKGDVRAYARKGQEPTLAEIRDSARTMDCIDCHNRPTHLYQIPGKAIDTAMENRAELQKLPFFKREAMKAVQGKYATRKGGMADVAKAIQDFYDKNYPAAAKELVKKGAETVAEVYGKISFPEMNTNWEVHPNHIGHPDPSTDEGFKGCWRCHDDQLSTADGKHTISQDCDKCHTFLVEDSPTPPSFRSVE